MFKIQKYLNFLYLNTTEPYELKKYKTLSKTCTLPRHVNEQHQLKKLNHLLNHAYQHVPYYKTALQACDIFKNGNISLSSLDDITKLPFLEKCIIREGCEQLYSDDHKNRKSFIESSGGSTGEPLFFLQDAHDNICNIGNFYLAKSWRGTRPHESEITIWGAPRDTFGDHKSFFETCKDFIRNRIVLNSFKMSTDDFFHYIEILNKHQPKLIISYAQSIYELALFAKENALHVKKQHAIHAAAGTLHDYMRETIEEVFQCKVFNHYGSRETGAIASECMHQNGLHIMMDHTLVEIVNQKGDPVQPGEQGEIVVTTLDNYSMPLIRYKMSDIAVMQEEKSFCPCGCTYPKLTEIIGRTTDIFKTINGDTVTPIFFKFLLGVRYNKGYIRSYQVIQEALDHIIIKIVKSREIPQRDLNLIEDKIKIVMGKTCRIDFEFVENIPKTETGKFLHTISKLT